MITLSDDCFRMYGKVDKNILPLVKVLNSLKYVRTMGSCGGHANPNKCQQPKGQWFVSFACSDDQKLPLVKYVLLKNDVGLTENLGNWFAARGKTKHLKKIVAELKQLKKMEMSIWAN